jgi:PHS family inorganic phosphate transporter-like MFS transporter
MVSELDDYQYEEKLLANNDSSIVLQSHKIELIRTKLNSISKIITSLGNFSVQYNFQSISIALLVMSRIQCTTTDDECKQGLQETWVNSTTSAVIFIGAIIGQLVMGTAGDILGRDKAMSFTLCLAAIGALSSSIFSLGNADRVYIIITCCRFLLGIGLGGVYPLSATKAAEDSSDDKGKVDTFAACMSYFWQVPGTMFPWIIALSFTYTNLSTDIKWRLLLGIGSIPNFIAVILSIIESKYRKKLKKILTVNNNDIDDKTDYGLKTSNHLKLMLISLKNKEIIFDLIATGGGWFIYDTGKLLKLMIQFNNYPLKYFPN